MTTNPHVEGITDPSQIDRCKFCHAEMPEDWEAQGWKERPATERWPETWDVPRT